MTMLTKPLKSFIAYVGYPEQPSQYAQAAFRDAAGESLTCYRCIGGLQRVIVHAMAMPHSVLGLIGKMRCSVILRTSIMSMAQSYHSNRSTFLIMHTAAAGKRSQRTARVDRDRAHPGVHHRRGKAMRLGIQKAACLHCFSYYLTAFRII